MGLPLQKTLIMTQSQTQKVDMTQGDIRSIMQRMTVPMLFGMITLMSFNLVDTFFISMLGTHELAAVSFTFPVTFTVISLAIGLSIGTSAVIAKAHGSGAKGGFLSKEVIRYAIPFFLFWLLDRPLATHRRIWCWACQLSVI